MNDIFSQILFNAPSLRLSMLRVVAQTNGLKPILTKWYEPKALAQCKLEARFNKDGCYWHVFYHLSLPSSVGTATFCSPVPMNIADQSGDIYIWHEPKALAQCKLEARFNKDGCYWHVFYHLSLPSSVGTASFCSAVPINIADQSGGKK
jgi:hypothetical protein